MQTTLPTRAIALFFFLCLLTGCAGVTRTPLDQNVSARLTQVESNLHIPADELIVRAKPSNITAALGGGLIPALIDASITSSRQTELEAITGPYYAETESIDFRTLFSEAFKDSIKDQHILPNLSVSVTSTGLSKSSLDERHAKLQAGQAFMGLRIQYEFSPDTRNVIVAAWTQLVTANHPEHAYKNSFMYISKPASAANPLEEWSADNGKMLAGAFTESAREIAYMLKKDLEAPGNEALFAALADRQKTKYTIPGFMPVTLNTFLLEQNEQRKIMRADSGIILSVPQ